MKKGISLIVLVITIIVLAILAGAIIISLSNTNIMAEAADAVSASDLANAKHAATLAYAEGLANGLKQGKSDGLAYTAAGAKMVASDYSTALTLSGLTASNYLVSVATAGAAPVVVASK